VGKKSDELIICELSKAFKVFFLFLFLCEVCVELSNIENKLTKLGISINYIFLDMSNHIILVH